jgi:hypothetical protein
MGFLAFFCLAIYCIQYYCYLCIHSILIYDLVNTIASILSSCIIFGAFPLLSQRFSLRSTMDFLAFVRSIAPFIAFCGLFGERSSFPLLSRGVLHGTKRDRLGMERCHQRLRSRRKWRKLERGREGS